MQWLFGRNRFGDFVDGCEIIGEIVNETTKGPRFLFLGVGQPKYFTSGSVTQGVQHLPFEQMAPE